MKNRLNEISNDKLISILENNYDNLSLDIINEFDNIIIEKDKIKREIISKEKQLTYELSEVLMNYSYIKYISFIGMKNYHLNFDINNNKMYGYDIILYNKFLNLNDNYNNKYLDLLNQLVEIINKSNLIEIENFNKVKLTIKNNIINLIDKKINNIECIEFKIINPYFNKNKHVKYYVNKLNYLIQNYIKDKIIINYKKEIITIYINDIEYHLYNKKNNNNNVILKIGEFSYEENYKKYYIIQDLIESLNNLNYLYYDCDQKKLKNRMINENFNNKIIID